MGGRGQNIAQIKIINAMDLTNLVLVHKDNVAAVCTKVDTIHVQVYIANNGNHKLTFF